MEIKRFGSLMAITVIASTMAACGGGGSVSAGSGASAAASGELEHDALGQDVLLRVSAKGVNSSSSDQRGDVELPLEDQAAFEQFAETGSLEQNCTTGSIAYAYSSSFSTNPTRVAIDFDMDADACFFETIIEDGDVTETIESTIDGVFSTDVAAELTGSTVEDIELQSLVIDVAISPNATERVAIDGFVFEALINEYDLQFALQDQNLVLNGIEDVVTTFAVDGEETELDQSFIYSDLTFAADASESDCPSSGTVTGAINGTNFEVNFANDMIDVTITGQGTENYSCAQLAQLLDDALEVGVDEQVSESDAMDRAYANAAYGSATGFATNMMFSQGIVF